MNPSDLAWWAWLLISGGAFLVGFLAVIISHETNDWFIRGVAKAVPFACVPIGLISGFVAFIRFVKFVWSW